MSRRISVEIGGRRGSRVGCVQRLAMRWRCHRRSVSGVTGQAVRRGRGERRGGDGAEEGSVAVVDRWSVDLAAKDGELVSKHDDLEFLGTTRADRQTGEHGDEAVENADHSSASSAASPLISAHDRIFGPVGAP